jgi:hypothetical protein
LQAGKLARSIWAETCATDEKDAILGVQQARNAMTACTYLATISVALATAGITIIFDENKMSRIEQLAVSAAHLPGNVSTTIWPKGPVFECSDHPFVTKIHQKISGPAE